MNVSRFAIVECEVRTFVVVEPASLLNGSICMFPIKKEVIKSVLDFEDAVDAFGQGILIAVANLTHAGADAGRLEPLTVGPRGVLNAMVRMMDQAVER